MKAYIAIFYLSRIRPGRYGEFIWTPELKCYVWAGKSHMKGRIFDLKTELVEFHKTADRVLQMETFPHGTVRFIAEDTAPVASDPDAMTMPIEEFAEVVRERSRELKCLQLKQAREAKAAKQPKPAPAPDPDVSRLEGEGGITLEPALAS